MSDDLGRIARSHRWTFFTNHAVVMLLISEQPNATTARIAELAGISRRAVQMIVRDLEEAGYITRERIGRRNRYGVRRDSRLRHAALRDRASIGDLLDAVGAPSYDGIAKSLPITS
jgi:DNA-binding MarR family transcriptional regulator